jgi:hypothetical protein
LEKLPIEAVKETLKWEYVSKYESTKNHEGKQNEKNSIRK